MSVRALIAVAALTLSGCASQETARTETDPWEPLNRAIFAFNDVPDRYLLKPVARGYQAVLPTPVRRGVGNFFDNLVTPRSMINNFLQGKPDRGGSDLGRFLINSTIGIGGIFDVASAVGYDVYNEDFGQTFAVWGVPDGPFIMIPLLGPSTLRDGVAFPLDWQANPLVHYDNSSVRDKLIILRTIDLRSRLLAADQLIAGSPDPYVTIRESFLQNRAYQVYDGDPPIDEDLYEEFDDLDDFEDLEDFDDQD